MVKKEQVGLVVLLIMLSGCGGRKTEKQSSYTHMQDHDVLSELDINDDSDLRSFFDEDEADIFLASEFVGWAEEKEVLDLDDFYDLSGTTYARAEGQEDEDYPSDEIVVALEDTFADSLDYLDEDSGEPVQTALDIDYEAQCSTKEVDDDQEDRSDSVNKLVQEDQDSDSTL